MHFYLSFGDKGLQSPPDDPAQWVAGLTVYTFLPQHSTFTGDDLLHHSALVFDQEIPKTYSRNSSLSCEHTPSPKHPASFSLWKKTSIWLDMSACPTLPSGILAKLWERDFKDEGSVITESIVNHNGACPALGVKVEALQEQLNALKPTASLNSDGLSFQVIPRWDEPLALLEKAYDSDR